MNMGDEGDQNSFSRRELLNDLFDDEFCTYKSKCYENHEQGQSKGKELL